MKQINIHHISCALALSLLWGCSDDVIYKAETVDNGRKEIRLQADIDQLNLSRADDSGFADGDRIGIYAVNFGADGNPSTLASTGNLADNVRFTFDETAYSWTGDRQLYFKDESTPVDFYGYYPYVEAVDNVNAYPFSVARNQSTEASGGKLSGYEASDFLWGKTAGVTPSTPIVTVTFRHLLSSAQVTLIEGAGFDDGEWASLDKSVIVSGTGRDALIDLATGTATLTGSRDNTGIIAAGYKENYRAVVIPQSVEAGEPLLDITVDGQSYQFRKTETMTYVPSKMHKFTIEVTKRMPEGDFAFNLIDEAITPWESDLLSHEGKVKEYMIVNVASAGGLGEALKNAGIDRSEVTNLKITGELNPVDFTYIRENMSQLEALNLKEVICRNSQVGYMGSERDFAIPYGALKDMIYLSDIVFPDKLEYIGDEAFSGTSLKGSLDFPESLIWIGDNAFLNWSYNVISGSNLTGELILPSSIKHIGANAFSTCDFSGPLILPDGLEEIGEGAFADCKYFSGELHLPSSLKSIGNGAFERANGLSGKLVIPARFTAIPDAFMSCGFTTIAIAGEITSIAEYAFCNVPLKGDFKVPESVTSIGRAAFAQTDLTHIILPPRLEFVEPSLCSDCKNLTDTITIPEGIETIGEGAFSGCPLLDAVVLPSSLLKINPGAFENDFSLTYLRCNANEPPVVDESAFYGINKDNFTVEVPEASVDAYRNAPGWKEFKRIAAYRNFIARPSKVNTLNKGGKYEIILNADAEWSVVSLPEWCHLDVSSGNKKTVINLTVDKLDHNLGNREGIVEFRLNDSEEHLTHINVGQYDYEHEEDSYYQLQAATAGRGIDVFVVGDGYDAPEIASGRYIEDMRQEIEYFFAVEPYTTYREYFNVYTAFALSPDSGIEDVNHWRTTKFHSQISNTDTRLSTDWMAAMDYCAEVCAPIVERENPTVGVILVANTPIYEGITYSVRGSDSFCAVVTKSTLDYPNDARGIVQHEACGHGFGWLGDEYMYHRAYIQKCKCTDGCGHVDKLLEDHSYGFALNLSLNGKYTEAPWSHLIFNPDYDDIVDIYEGGYFHSRGVYRSEYNSCMNNNVPYFSTWSRQLIVQRIMKLAGEEFSLDRFYALDRRDMGRDFTSTSRNSRQLATGSHIYGQPPVFIDNYKFGKKGGRR